jgi:S1-C subfamily serine protease
LVEIDAEGLPWLPLAGLVELRDLVLGVGHPQGLKWAMYGGRVSYTDPELFWDGGAPDQYDLRLDAVDVGQGSSGSPIVNMAGEMVAVLSGSLADLSASRSWRHLDGKWVESVVFWEQGLLDAAIHSLTMGPRVDLVREFVELRRPGMLAALPD